MNDYRQRRWYLAGPMSGIPQFNFPMFDAVSAALRGREWDVISPAELDDPETRAQALASKDGHPSSTNRTWGDFLSRDVKIVADQVQGILLLPGWEKSRGARLAAFVGLLAGHEFRTLGLIQNPAGQVLGLMVHAADRNAVMRMLSGVTDTLEDFQRWITERWGPADLDDEKRVAIVALGLGGEAGEVQEHFKKFLRDGRPLHTPECKEELGDQFHYWMRACELAGFTPYEVIEANKAKLIERDQEAQERIRLAEAEHGRQMQEANE